MFLKFIISLLDPYLSSYLELYYFYYSYLTLRSAVILILINKKNY